MSELTAVQAASIFFLDKSTGLLFWKISPSKNVPHGSPAGTATTWGYLAVKWHRKIYRAHRIVWLMETGDWPEDKIDHVNGVKSDNRFENLRLATSSQNCCNKAIRPDNTSGFKGVHFNKRAQRFTAAIKLHGKRTFLGGFDTAEDAFEAYCSAAAKLHGEFANLGQYPQTQGVSP